MANGRTAEVEFEIALQRAKDRAEAREHYFADARRQFEETRANWERDIVREKSLRIETERWGLLITPRPRSLPRNTTNDIGIPLSANVRDRFYLHHHRHSPERGFIARNFIAPHPRSSAATHTGLA